MSGWIFSVLDAFGELGVGVLIALENLIPPIPSELVLPLAGFRARTGELHLVGVWVAATVGAVAGAVILYYLGRWAGYERLRRLAGKRWFVFTSVEDLERGRRLFDAHGSWLVLAARCVPVMRSLISIPAGLGRMPLAKYVALTTVGSGVWNAAFIAAGWLLGEHWNRIDAYTGPAGFVVIAAIVVALGVLACRRARARRSPVREREHSP